MCVKFVCVCVKFVCVKFVCVRRREEEAVGGGGVEGARDTESKTRTPHKDVGNEETPRWAKV